jgi:hypothetical protein
MSLWTLTALLTTGEVDVSASEFFLLQRILNKLNERIVFELIMTPQALNLSPSGLAIAKTNDGNGRIIRLALDKLQPLSELEQKEAA